MFNLVSCVWIIYVFIKNFMKRMAGKCNSPIKHSSVIATDLLLSHNEFNKVASIEAPAATAKTYDQQCSGNSNNNNNNSSNNDNPQAPSLAATHNDSTKPNVAGQTTTGYLEKECETEDDDDDGKECKGPRTHCEKVDIYLETPVVDENNELMLMISTSNITSTTTATISSSMAKPKRLSDEFFSADDGEYDNDDVKGTAVTHVKDKLNMSLPLKSSDVQTCAELPPEENSTDRLISRTAYIEDEISSCSNLIDIDNEHDESSPHSSISPTVMNLVDGGGDEANHGDDYHHGHLDNMFYTNDVQSMDAIERKDFIHEQKMTGGIILKGSSLISGDNRLNLGLLNIFSQKLDRSGKCKEDNQIMETPSQQNDSSEKLSTTPTSSRTKTVRSTGSTKSTTKINLSESLEKYADPSANESEIVNISNRLGTDSPLGESSTLILANSNGPKVQPQFDAFMNCNSSDSLQSDKSCRIAPFTGSSCSNFEFATAITVDNNKTSRCLSTANEECASSSCCTNSVAGNNISGGSSFFQNTNDECCSGIPSTSKAVTDSSSTCQYSNHSCHLNPLISHEDNKSDEKLSKSKLDEMNVDETPIIAPSQNDQHPDNFESSDMASATSQRLSSEAIHQPLVEEGSFNQLTAMDTNQDYDEDTWVDCEDSYDIEEICTCQDYSDEDAHGCSEDELPSRDVDLSGYTHLDSISEDILQEGNSQTQRVYRKRKITETRIHCGDMTSSGNGGANSNTGDTTPGNRKRLALESVVSPKLPCTPSTPTTLTITSPSSVVSLGLSEKRTPRSIIPTRENPPPELSDWLLQFQRWSHAERLLAVDRLIEHCEPTQVRHMMKVIEPQFQRDFISLLPKELALQVLSYLDPKDLLRAAQTCRSWRFLCDDNLLWKEKCKKACIVIEPNTDRPKRGRAGNMPPISSQWKAAYMRQHIIEMNWRSRPIRSPKVLKGHDDHVITCLQFCGNRIVSGSDDNTLKVWSAITGKCLRTLVGHTGGVWSSQMSGNIIISGSTDRTLKVWNADSGLCNHTLYGHTSTVRCMHLHGRKVVSGSRDATLRVWDIAQGKCLHILVGHLAAVRCVQYDGKLVVSGAYDYMVKVWNPERQECLHTLQGHTNRVYSLQFDGVHVVSGSLDTSIRVWDAETGSCKHTLMGHQSLTSGMELRQNILVSGNADSTVKVWDITSGQCLQTLSGPNKHQSAVTCLQFNSRFVVTSSDDGTVKLWDVRTGEFIRNLVALDSGGSGGVVWRIRANDTKLICAVGSRNGTEETKLMVLDFDVEGACLKCS